MTPSRSLFQARNLPLPHSGFLAVLLSLALLSGCLSDDDDDDDGDESPPASAEVHCTSIEEGVQAERGEPASIEVGLENTGEEQATDRAIQFEVMDTAIEKEQAVTLAGGEEKTVTFEVDTAELEADVYGIRVDTGDETETADGVLQLNIASLDLGEHAGSLEEPKRLKLAEHRPGADEQAPLRLKLRAAPEDSRGLVIEDYQPEELGDRIWIHGTGTDESIETRLADGELEMARISPPPEDVVDPEPAWLQVNVGEDIWSVELEEVYGPPYDAKDFIEAKRIEVTE